MPLIFTVITSHVRDKIFTTGTSGKAARLAASVNLLGQKGGNFF